MDWVGSGAVLLVVLGLISLGDAARAAAKGSDVYFFLTGMMLLSDLAREQGVFDWVSGQSVSFWDFLKVGAFAMPLALACALAGLLATQALTGH